MSDYYDRNPILCREVFYGEGYSSVGGEEVSKILAGFLRKKSDLSILDVGSGPGGFAFFIARTLEANVIGIDISENMVTLAQERLACSDVAQKVKFQLSNVETVEFPAECFDAVFWRSSLLHIPIRRKEGVLRRMMKWLKPGGQFISMDLCSTNDVEDGQGFQQYLDYLHAECLDVESYEKLLKKVGLKEIFVKEDNNAYMRKTAEEIADADRRRSDILKLVSEETYQSTLQYWFDKRKWIEARAISHVYFVAHK
ncbi:uncharacterized protein [Oscarella lobularis]|uniref:uncharacterized protein n=1 Tax=Oscarella lobularis TaxID=121494 RepID=UPI0033143EF5